MAKQKQILSDEMTLYLLMFPFVFDKITCIDTPNLIFTVDTFKGKDGLDKYRAIFSKPFEKYIVESTAENAD